MRPHQDGAARPGMLLGGLLVLLGVLFLLQNFGLFEVEEIWQYWPVLLIALGIARISHAEGEHGKILGGILVVIGCGLLVHNLGLFRFHMERYWPVLLILIGLFFLIRTMEGHQSQTRHGDSTATLNDWAVFSGVERRIDSQEFRGGEVLAIFGGVELDLSRANLAEARAIIDVNAVFGGVEVRIPADWTASLKGASVFGAFKDETVHPRLEGPIPPKLLIIGGFAVFGGVTVKN